MRDGPQIEKRIVPTAQKIRWIEALIASGVDLIQVGSFVHPETVPQTADAAGSWGAESPPTSHG